jgi:hypothetical protein
MRHWLAGVLAREQPALFRDLPESFRVGMPLPLQPLSRPRRIRKRNSAARSCKHCVHGPEFAGGLMPLKDESLHAMLTASKTNCRRGHFNLRISS